MNLLLLFYAFFKIGIFGFGGGLAMLPFIFQVAQQMSDMSMQEFSNLVVLSQITPGPLAVNAATYVGYNSAGLLGATLATLGVSTPSFFLVLAVSNLIERWRESRLYAVVFEGVRAATVGLVAAAGVMICKSSLFDAEALSHIKKMFRAGTFFEGWESAVNVLNLFESAVFAICIILILKFKISAVKLMLSVAVCATAISFI